MQSYIHFTLTERESLHQLVLAGVSIAKIAEKLGRNRSSLYRELKRNGNKNGEYHPWRATSMYLYRRKRCRRQYRLLKDEALLQWVKKGLDQYWPPEAIVAKWKIQNPKKKLSHSTIYRAISNDILQGYAAKTHLRRRGKVKYGNRGKFNTIKPENTIHDRPWQANQRTRIGDWEGDTVFGAAGKGVLVTLADRFSRLLVAGVSKTHSSADVSRVMNELLSSLPVESITLDNGSEFARYKTTEKALNTTVYFADPHSPWQRGSNENLNGALRFFFPRGTDFHTTDPEYVSYVLGLLNNRPRKCLGWLSPFEVFSHACRT